VRLSILIKVGLQSGLAAVFEATLDHAVCSLGRFAHLMAIMQDQLHNFLIGSVQVSFHGSSFRDKAKDAGQHLWIAHRFQRIG
jgi:hypothetical protein